MKVQCSIIQSPNLSGVESPLLALNGNQDPLSVFFAVGSMAETPYDYTALNFAYTTVTGDRDVTGKVLFVNQNGSGNAFSWDVYWHGGAPGDIGNRMNMTQPGCRGFWMLGADGIPVTPIMQGNGGTDTQWGCCAAAKYKTDSSNETEVVLHGINPTTYQEVNGSFSYTMPAGFDAVIYFIGRRLADLPLGDWKPSDYGLRRVPSTISHPLP